MKTSCLLKVSVLFFFYLFSNSLFAQVNLSQGLIAYYPFNGNANDVSGNGNNGILQNNIQLTNDRLGNANSAYAFDGIDDYIRVPNSSTLNPSAGLSVALYFKASQNTVQTFVGKISYSQGVGTQFQVGMGFPLYPGVFSGVNPPNTGCSGQIAVNSSYVNNGSISLNQWHCMVSTFENGIQKLYVDGVLVQTVNTGFSTLNQCNNSDIQIGSWWLGDVQFFKGVLDDIRIYNRALNQDEVNTFCGFTQTVIPSFALPDTVCVNTSVNITNTSIGASSYYWNFCTANINKVPTGASLGNPGGQLTTPCFIDYAYQNGNWYGFITSNNPPSLVRLEFGNSLLNTPTAVNLGNFGGMLPYGAQGIQLVQEGANWYAFITGGDSVAVPGQTSRILKLDIGPSLTNNNPTMTNWGNVGGLSYPVDLYMFKDAGIWYGFTVNYYGATVTRFNFGSNFNSPPIGTNLGNLGNLNLPSGICPINDNGTWRVFVSNFGSNSLSRIDFGNSLLNAPTSSVNLGNLGGRIQTPRDLYIFNYCNESVGFLINDNTSDLVRLNFSGLNTVPVATTLGNVGGFQNPHSISKIFRVGADLFAFVPNSYVNTVSRIKFSGCNNANTSNATLQNPAPVFYDSPGTYNINLMVDEGLSTQSAFCKQVVVLPAPTHSPIKSVTLCPGGSIKIGSSIKPANYHWNIGAATDSIVIDTGGIYWVESDRYGCSVRDSFIVSYLHLPLDFGFQQDICSPKTLQFNGIFPGVQSYKWDFGNGQTNNSTLGPTVIFDDYGLYSIKLSVKYNGSCLDSITKSIFVENLYDDAMIINKDTTICLGDSILLKTVNAISNYCWKASTGAAPVSLSTYVKPVAPTTYILNSQVVGSNLVTNPEFTLGNSGFNSDYNYANTNVREGEYWVGSSSLTWNRNMADCHDHTSGSGNMMLVNGSPVAKVKVWSQTVSVTPHTNYNFSVWISSLHFDNPARLHFAINGVELGNDITAGTFTCQWKQFFSTWNSGDSATAVISIVNNNTIVDGNDFALDDIFFGQVTTKTDSVTINVVGLCDSVKISGVNKVCSPSDTLTYSIYKSPNCSQQYSIQVDNTFATIISQTSTSTKLLFKKNGTTSIKVTYANNCKVVIDSLDISIRFSPTSINLGPDIVTCRDTSVTLKAPEEFISYTWQDGSKDSTYTINSSGAYSVMAQNLCGLQLKDTIRFVKSAVVPFTVSPVSVTACKGDSIQFRASGGSVYTWSPSPNFSNPSSAFTKALIRSSQNFTVFISDQICNRDTTFVIPVTVSEGANIYITKSNDVNCSNDSAILIASGGLSYIWTPNLYIANTNGNSITVKPYQNTTYRVTGKDALGCYGQDSVTVYFSKEGDQKLFVPTAFSPNGDGKNDFFRPLFTGPYTKYDFQIYNRWGQLVYESKMPGAGWNGIVNGTLQKADVYVFYISAEGGCNGQFVRKGTFVLIR
jgi:gliding motility-associated-like protein